jgi:hypothetical protein
VISVLFFGKQWGKFEFVSTMLQADEKGMLHVPSSLLPNGEPLATYRVETESGQLIIANVVEEQQGSAMGARERAEAFLKWARKPRPAVGLSKYAVGRDSMYD